MTHSARVATVSLNPAIDQTARVPDFTAGAVNRVEWQQSDAGGKGVNVASFLADAGLRVVVTGILGEANKDPFVHLFEDKGIEDRFVRVAGSTRVNVKIVDEIQDRVTDINFPGLQVDEDDLRALFSTIESLAADTEWFVLSGSVPAGLPTNVYAQLVSRLKELGKIVVLDASGPAFAEAVPAGPDVIKPNIDELEELVGRRLDTEDAIVDAGRVLVAGAGGGKGGSSGGIALVAVSMGPRGALFMTRDEVVHAKPPAIHVKSTVGAGDAMVAGIVAGALRGLDLAGRARLATAFSLGALSEIGPRLPPPATIEAFAEKVSIRRITAQQTQRS
jgi:1-phosphofructokinase family hexose kinase